MCAGPLAGCAQSYELCFLCSEKSHEYDFLSSIEVVIMDQTDVFLMQNWEHVQVQFSYDMITSEWLILLTVDGNMY